MMPLPVAVNGARVPVNAAAGSTDSVVVSPAAPVTVNGPSVKLLLVPFGVSLPSVALVVSTGMSRFSGVAATTGAGPKGRPGPLPSTLSDPNGATVAASTVAGVPPLVFRTKRVTAPAADEAPRLANDVDQLAGVVSVVVELVRLNVSPGWTVDGPVADTCTDTVPRTFSTPGARTQDRLKLDVYSLGGPGAPFAGTHARAKTPITMARTPATNRGERSGRWSVPSTDDPCLTVPSPPIGQPGGTPADWTDYLWVRERLSRVGRMSSAPKT